MNIRNAEFVVIISLVFFIYISGGGNISGMSVSMIQDGIYENTVLTENGIELTGQSGSYISGDIGDEKPKYWTVFRINATQPLCTNYIELNATEDTFISSKEENDVFGEEEYLEAKNKSGISISFIRFPAFYAGTVKYANLSLSIKKAGDILYLYKAVEGWNENSTWQDLGAEWNGFFESDVIGSVELDKKGKYETSLDSDISWLRQGLAIAALEKESRIESAESENPPKLLILYESNCTSIRSQIKLCESAGCNSSFTGPDGTSSSFYNSSEFAVNKWARYIQHAIYLQSEDAAITPYIHSIEADFIEANIDINYSFYVFNRTLEATAIANDSAGNNLSEMISWTYAGSEKQNSTSLTANLSEGNNTFLLSVSYSGMSGSANFTVEMMPEITVDENYSTNETINQTDAGQNETLNETNNQSESVANQTINLTDSQQSDQPESIEQAVIQEAEKPPQSSGSSSYSIPKASGKYSSNLKLSVSSENKIHISNKDIPVKEITTYVNTDISGVRIDVKIVNEPLMADKNVFQMIDIEPSINNTQIENAEIKFRVDKEWIKRSGVSSDDILMMRYHDGEWQELQTYYVEEDETSITYNSITPGFSIFAITAAKKNIEAIEEPSSAAIQQEDKINTITIFSNTSAYSPVLGIIAIILIAILGAGLHHLHVKNKKVMN